MPINNMPVFILKAKDNLSDQIVQAYVNLCYNSGLPEQGEQAQLALDEIRQWRAENPDKCKFPDHTHIPADNPASQGEPMRIVADGWINPGDVVGLNAKGKLVVLEAYEEDDEDDE
jgi:hypothetical protein